jgi:hypothetical protein
MRVVRQQRVGGISRKEVMATQYQFMLYQQHRLTISSNQAYSVPQLRMMIREAEEILARSITLEEWDDLS